MTAQGIKMQDNDTCEKCGSKMIVRKFSFKNNGAAKWKYIKQCKVCRHWINIQ